MEGFGLLIGHLLGDYILQNDWTARMKVKPWPGRKPVEVFSTDTLGIRSCANPLEMADYYFRLSDWRKGHVACFVHCLLYTFAIFVTAFWWLPAWAYAVVFLTHYPIDRFRLARLWMIHLSGQKDFATGPLTPWSVIVVDNTFHLLTLFLIGVVVNPPVTF